jgi:Flp pilus assembly protein TadB
MSGETTSSQRAVTQDRPTGELVKDLSEELSRLVRDELRLAQLEMTRKGKQAGLGIGLFAGSGGIAVYGLGCLIACAVIAIATVLAAWLAALVVGAALLLVAGIAALVGKGRLSRATPPVPEETIGSVKADVDEIKERTHR